MGRLFNKKNGGTQCRIGDYILLKRLKSREEIPVEKRIISTK
jgi:hypothetical protein